MQAKVIVVENTRQVSIRLEEGVTGFELVELLNQRQVKLVGTLLIACHSEIVLGHVVTSVNSSDYRVAPEESPLPALDTVDVYDYGFNLI